MAFETGLRGAPNVRLRLPRFLASERWNVVPAILITIALVLTIFPSLESLGSTPIRWATAQIVTRPTAQSISTAPAGFSQQVLFNLGKDFLRLPRPCKIKLLAPTDNQIPRDQLVSVAENASIQFLNRGTSIIDACEVIDEVKDRNPLIYGPHEFPPVGITIHTSQNTLETREFLGLILHSYGVQVTGDSNLPLGSPDNLIYIEIGQRLF